MKILKKVLKLFAVLIAILLVVGLVLPSDWEVSRSTMIKAPPSVIYPYIANLKKGWPLWSSFDYEDPEIQYTSARADEGPGATRSWISKRMGDGSQKITSGDPANGIDFELLMDGTQFVFNGSMKFEPLGEMTKVIWTDRGNVGQNILFKYM